MSKSDHGLSITPTARFATGCIATLELPDGTRVSRHFTGDGTVATRACASFADETGARILSLSTPRTIFRDLKGTRAQADPDGDSWFGSPPIVADLDTPERSMLSRIGRMDLA